MSSSRHIAAAQIGAEHEKAELFVGLADEVIRLRGRLLTLHVPPHDGVLSGPQMLVLNAIVKAPMPPTVPRIARSLGHSRQAVQRVVDALVAVDYVRLADNPDHKRARLLVPTEKGRGIREEGADHAHRLAC